MKLLVACDAHIFRTPDGSCWCKSIYGYSFWVRYLGVFDDVKIVARLKDVPDVSAKMLRVDGAHVEVYGIPFYQGPKELLAVYAKIKRALKNVDADCGAALMRMPSQTASMVYSCLRKDIPVAGEIVYDITDDISNPQQSAIVNILNRITSEKLKRFCKKANGVSYVTEHSIQNNYPCTAMIQGESEKYFTSSYSTITLSNDAFTGPRDFTDKKSIRLALSSVAMNSERKGEKIVIKVVQLCRERGYDVSAVLIGDGSLRPSFEAYAKALGVSDYVEFTGLLPSSEHVREVLQDSDIFIFPSQGEGLPRGILEAMAIGMPVLSTPVGGIPEVISKKYLFDAQNAKGFSDEICALMDNAHELNEMSACNYRKSLEFRNDILQRRRDDFYLKLRNLAE